MATAIYRRGSKGDGVKEIQRLLCAAGFPVSADGDFGARTEDAVKAFQRSRGLSPVDGIVGPVTIRKLQGSQPTGRPQGDDRDGLHITPGYINTHISFCVGRHVKYIAIHYTAGSTSRPGAALATRNVFLQRAASADFVVDDGTVVQINPDIRNYYCWAVGDKKNPWTGGGRLNGKAMNKNAVSIEICSNLRRGASPAVANHDGWYFTDQSLENTRKLVRYLMKTYGIPKENVIRHYDATGKLCPGIPGWNDGPLFTTDGKQTKEKSRSTEWEKFWKSL